MHCEQAHSSFQARVAAAWLRDERGNVVVSYLIVTALAIAMGLAVIELRSPIQRAAQLAACCLAGNNP